MVFLLRYILYFIKPILSFNLREKHLFQYILAREYVFFFLILWINQRSGDTKLHCI